MKFTKDALYAGTYFPKGKPITFSKDRVKHLGTRLKEMIGAGLQIPLAWEHQDDARPMTPAEAKANTAKFNLGHAEWSELTPEGFLKPRFDVPVDGDAERLKAAKFVSPEIVSDFIDGNGKLWPGESITHFAVTARPIQHHQKPFQPFAGGTPVSLSCIRLSLEDVEMAKEDDKPKGDEGNGDAVKKLKEVLKALCGDGYVLPDDTTMENLLDRLHTAALTKAGPKPEEAEVKPNEGEITEAQSPVMLSMQTRLSAIEAENSALKSRTIEAERASIVTRIKSLKSTGRVTKAKYDKLMADAGKVQLSLDKSGAVASNDMLVRLEELEERKAGCEWPTRLGQAEEVPLPEDDTGDKAEQEKMADRLSGGRYSANKAKAK